MTQPHPASAAQASKSLSLTNPSETQVVSDSFSDILDVPPLRDAMWAAIGDMRDERDVRSAVVSVLKEAQITGRDAVAARLHARPRNALPVTTGYT
ncbi:MAG: hypothetical protein NWQ37_09515, partial [Marivita lacus]|nr:hypothetical protein [Marivita lacus]